MKTKPERVKRTVSVTRHVADVVVLGVTVAAAWFLWPSFLGGSSRMITVQGHSMEPTYVTGDLVILDTAATPEIGKIVVFQIPKDVAGGGHLIVHRVIGIRPDGTYITQGDNAPNPDVFLTKRADILGSPRFSIPHGAEAIGTLSSPIGLAVAIGGLCTALLWPRKRGDEDEGGEVDESSPNSDEQVITPIMRRVEDADVAAEAEAWLREQLDLAQTAR